MVSGTLGLVLIGALAVMVTPRQEDGPLAVRTSPSLVDPAALVPVTTALFEIALGELTSAFGAPRAAAEREPQERPPHTATTIVADTARVPTSTLAVAVEALATPLQSGVAIVTARSIGGRSTGDQIAVRLASGATVDAEIVATFGHAAFVTLGSVPADEPTHHVAASAPGDDDMVTVLVSPPRSVRLGELAAVGAPEGTAVVDADGHLIGLCTETDDGSIGLAMADPGPGELTTASTTAPVSSAPTREAAPASSASTAPTSAPPATSAPVSTTAGTVASARPGAARHD
jgi:hypothetical protein